MASCFTFRRFNGSGDSVYRPVDLPVEECVLDATNEVILSNSEYAELSAIRNTAELFQTYFAFDRELFLEISGWMLLMYVVGFGVGRVVNILDISNKIG